MKPEWRADREVGVWLKGDEDYNPEPDVTVIDTAVAIGQMTSSAATPWPRCCRRATKKAVLEAKLRYEEDHEHNRCVLFVRQDRVGAVQHDRQAGGGWRRRQLTTPGAALAFPDIGTVGRLGDLYRSTPLDPFAKH